MKQRLHITLSIFVLALAFMLHSCKPESPCNPNEKPASETYWLSADAKSKIPFRADGLDTLVYISDAGDTATLYGQGVDSFYRSESKNRNPDPDCPVWDSWKYETILFDFKGLNNRFNRLEFTYKAENDFRITSNEKGIGFATILRLNTPVFYDTTILINNTPFTCTRLSPIRPDTNTIAFFNAEHGLMLLELKGFLWKRKI